MKHLDKFIETESRTVVTRSWKEGGHGEFLFNEYKVSISADEKFWRWLHTNVNVLNATELYTYRFLKW